MKKNKHIKHLKFKKTDLFKSWKKCKKIQFVLLFDILAILLVISTFFVSSTIINSYVKSQPELISIFNEISQMDFNDKATLIESDTIRTLIFNEKEHFFNLIILIFGLLTLSLLFANVLFSVIKGVSWSFARYGKLKKKFVVGFFKKSFLWLFVWFFVIFLLATAFRGFSGIIILQILMLFYFYLTFFVFYPLLVWDYKIGFKKLFKKTWKCGMKFRNFIVLFLLYIIALVFSLVFLGLFSLINPILGVVVFLLLLFFYLAFQKYYLLRIIEKVEKKCD